MRESRERNNLESQGETILKRKKGKRTGTPGKQLERGKEGNNQERQGETIDAASQETTGMLGETKFVKPDEET